MPTSSLRVRYRPVRIGWCVRQGNWAELQRAMELSHCFWGGRNNPVVVADSLEGAKSLIAAFRVDCLYPVGGDPELKEFVKGFPHLPWPTYDEELFEAGTEPNFLDIYHPVQRIHDQFIARKDGSIFSPMPAAYYEWQEDDPLRFVLLATYGAYPPPAISGHRDYRALVKRNLNPNEIRVLPDEPISPTGNDHFTPSEICRFGLEWDHSPFHTPWGFYIGRADDFRDVVDYWNLRAAELEMYFYDPKQATRLKLIRESHERWIRSRPRRTKADERMYEYVPVWSRDVGALAPLKEEGLKMVHNSVEADMWEGYSIRPPSSHLGSKSVLASISPESNPPNYTFQLPDKPLQDDIEFSSQHLIVSLRPPFMAERFSDSTFTTPFIPALNCYYGQKAYFDPDCVRAEQEGLGVIVSASSSDLTIHAIRTQEFFRNFFAGFGIKAEASHPGRFATRLIHQMGGLQGCRVFKIRGVRALVERYGPLEPFTKGAAIQLIGGVDPNTGRPTFTKYENLFIEPRERGKLSPEQVFNYLAERRVFRVGLSLVCPTCDLAFWIPIEEAETQTECEYCGQHFNIIRQLRDRDWAYRRSGLFGKNDHQEGSIPVALTLQQLDTTLGRVSAQAVFITGQQLTPSGAAFATCEADFIVLLQLSDGTLEVAFGECKSAGGEITDQDVTNLSSVAEVFESSPVHPFIIFSKTAAFTSAEIERCKRAQGKWRLRVILLSARELEPYLIYQDTGREFDVRRTTNSFHGLAEATHSVFFEPKQRSSDAEGPNTAQAVATPSATAGPGGGQVAPSKFNATPESQLRQTYQEHNAPSARSGPAETQCQCNLCQEYRLRFGSSATS